MINTTTTPRVYLVGAGPGDPDLLTIKALRAIQSAQVVLVDDLVSQPICDLINERARIIYVGKRGGCKSTPQAFIEKLMIQEAYAGHTVIRLKGGDPFIFGRGGEEVENLQKAGVQVEVINGITAGLAAVSSLGVSLTHREHAHGVIFLTGHLLTLPENTSAKPLSPSHLHASISSPITPDEDTLFTPSNLKTHNMDWALIGQTAQSAKLTLVIYMGIKGLQSIASGLLTTMSADTPASIIENATLPHQRSALTRLDQLHTTALRESLQSPCVIVIGDILKGLRAIQEQSPSPCENIRFAVP